jgi:hypothetical protein
MSIVMSPAEEVVLEAPVPVKEKEDDLVQEEREERDVVVDGVAESALLETEDLRKRKKSLMRRWRITGEQRRMAPKVVHWRLILKWWNKPTMVCEREANCI